MKSFTVTTQMKAIEHNMPVVSIVQYFAKKKILKLANLIPRSLIFPPPGAREE